MATRTEKIEFVVSARDTATQAVARTRANVAREMKEMSKEAAKLRIGGNLSIADRAGLAEGRSLEDKAARKQLAAQLRGSRSEFAGISDEENAVRQAVAQRLRAKQNERIADEASKRLGEKPNRLKELKGALGEESALGNVGKMLKGAGAIAGFAVIGQVLNDATGKARELVEQFRAGEISSGQMVENIAAGLPVIGNFWQAGRNIREMFTGEEAAAREILKLEKLRNAALDMRKAALERVAEVTRKTDDVTRVAGQKRTLDRLAPGASRDRLELAQGGVNDRAGLGAEYEKGKKEITDRYSKLDGELQAELRKTNKPEKMKEINASIKTLAAGRNDELLALEKEHNAKINALGEDQVRDRAKLEKRIIADAAGAMMERLGGWKDAILKWSDRNTADKNDSDQNSLGVASRLAKLKGDNPAAERIDKAAELKRRLAEIDQRAVDEARNNPTDQAAIKARAAKAREQATLETGLDLVAMQRRNALRAQVDLPSFSGDVHGMSGFMGQGVSNAAQLKGAIDPMVEAQKEVKKLQGQTNDILKQVRDAISGLVNKLQVIPPGEGA